MIAIKIYETSSTQYRGNSIVTTCAHRKRATRARDLWCAVPGMIVCHIVRRIQFKSKGVEVFHAIIRGHILSPQTCRARGVYSK